MPKHQQRRLRRTPRRRVQGCGVRQGQHPDATVRENGVARRGGRAGTMQTRVRYRQRRRAVQLRGAVPVRPRGKNRRRDGDRTRDPVPSARQ